MQKNVAGQKIGAQLVSATDGSAFTGSVTVSVTGDAGTQATGSVGSGACTHEGNGYHTYAPAQAETNYDLIAFTFTGTGAVPVTVQVFTRWDGNVTQWLGTAAATPTVAGVAQVEVIGWNGSSLLPLVGKTIYVATTGNDSNSGTKASPKLTVNGAIAIAVPGDRIEVGSGTFTGAVSNSVDRLKLCGAGKDATILTHSSGKTLTNTGDYFVCENMSVRTTSTTTDTNQRAISDEGTYQSRYSGLYVIGWSDGFYLDNCQETLIEGCRIQTAWDGIQSAPSFGTRIIGCYITGGGEYGSTVETRGICAGFGMEVRRCQINMARTLVSITTGRTIAIQSDAAHVRVFDSLLIAKDEVEESTANAVCFAGGVATGATGALEGCYLSSVHGNGSKAKDIDASGASAYVTVRNTRYNTAKVLGSSAIYAADGPLRPTTNGYTLDVTATGAAGIDWANVESPTTTLALTNTTVDLKDDAIDAGAVAASGAAEMATTLLDTALSGHTTSGTVGKQLQNAGTTSAGGPIEQRSVAASRVIQVRDRGDGTFGIIGNGIQMMPGERQIWALEFKGTLLSPGSNLYGMSEPDEDGDEAANLTINDYGVDRTQAKAEMTLSGSATTNDDIEVDFTVQISSTETVVVTVPVTVGS